MLEHLKLGPRYDGLLFLAEAARNPPVLRPHRHVELELNLVVRGSITYVVGGQRNTFGPRSLVWLFPDQEHQLVDRSPDAQYFVAVFKPELIAQAARGQAYQGLHTARRESDPVLRAQLDAQLFDHLRHSMALVVADGLDPDLLNRESGFGAVSDFVFAHHDPDGLNAALRHIVLLCWRSQQKHARQGSAVALHPAVQRALAIVSDGARDQSLASLAAACGVSEAYLSRVFARQMGVPLSRYRNSVRLGRFLELCRAATTRSLTDAVFAAGFGSYAQFYQVFTQAYGAGPRQVLRLGGPDVMPQ